VLPAVAARARRLGRPRGGVCLPGTLDPAQGAAVATLSICSADIGWRTAASDPGRLLAHRERMASSRSRWTWVSLALLAPVFGSGGCKMGLEPCNADDPARCDGDSIVSCDYDSDQDGYVWNTWNCSAREGTCRVVGGSPTCVLDQHCDAHTSGACIDGRAHECQGGYVLANGPDCYPSPCRILPELDATGATRGNLLATCAVDSTPCTIEYGAECRGNQLTECYNHYAMLVEKVCPDDHPCTVTSPNSAACAP
jgi:hypothetical protein